MKNLILSINFLTILLISVTTAQKNCPTSLADDADEAFGKVVLYGDRSIKWGTTEKEVESTCKGVKSADKKVRKFLRNCLTGLPQQVLGLVLKGAVKQVKRLCVGGKKQKELFKHSKCGNSNLPSDHDCMDNFVGRLKDAATNLPDDLKLGSSCCSFIQFENCIIGRMEKEAKCTKDDVEHFKTIVHSTASEAMDFSCGEYNANPSKCDHINEKLKNGKKSDMKAKSIMVPLIHLISKIA